MQAAIIWCIIWRMSTFKDYWLALPTAEREALASRCGYSPLYLRNLAYGTRKASPLLAAVLERETGGKVTRKDFFPDNWHIIWPELS